MSHLKQGATKSGAGFFARACVAALAVMVLGGCDGRSTPPTPNPVPTATPVSRVSETNDTYTTPRTTAALREAAREAGDELRDLGNRIEARIESTDFEAKKETFLRNSRDELDQLKASIDKLGERTGEAGENAKENFQEWLNDLRVKSRDADTEWERARDSTGERWEETQVRAQSAMQRLKEAYNNTLEKMKINE